MGSIDNPPAGPRPGAFAKLRHQPFALDELLARVHAVLRRTKPRIS